MKVLFADCRRYEGQRQEGSEKAEDCLAVFVCAEEGDGILQTKRLEKDILHLAGEFNKKSVFIAPFAHLSHKLMKFDDAERLFEDIQKRVVCLFEQVTVSGFNVEKGFMLDVYRGPKNILFRSYT